MAIVDVLGEHGKQESADTIVVAQGCYLRASDWRLVEREDVVGPEDDMAIKLGVASTGEATKTGTNQGVRPDLPETKRTLHTK